MRNIIEKIIRDNAQVKNMYCRNYKTYDAAIKAMEDRFKADGTFTPKEVNSIAYIVVNLPHGRHKGRWIPVLTSAGNVQTLINASLIGFVASR